MGIYVVRAFVQMRQASALHADLARRLMELEERTGRLETGTACSAPTHADSSGSCWMPCAS
jgi:hypothetical protein